MAGYTLEAESPLEMEVKASMCRNTFMLIGSVVTSLFAISLFAGCGSNSTIGPAKNHFVPDPGKAALVIIDMQNFSCAPAYGKPMPGIKEVIKQVNRLADSCREEDIPVIWVRQNFTSNGSANDAGLYPLFHDEAQVQSITNRGPGTEIYPGMHYDPLKDHVVFKNRYSAFLSDPPELRNLLKELGKTQLVVAGVAANVCVECTVRDAVQLDYQVILVSDAVTSPDEALLNSTLTNTRLFFGDVRSAGDVIAELQVRK